MLPAPPRHFVDRVAVLDRLDLARTDRPGGEGPLVVVLSGVGGVGKTGTALRWLHRLREEYPGPHLYADLSPQGPGRPRDPIAVLEALLRELGADDLPADGLPEAFRTRTDERPVLMLLDNAVSAAQVRTLLPRAGVVVVTSRSRLTGLGVDGAELVPVVPLDEESVTELLGRLADPDAVSAVNRPAVIRACGGLPLAVRITGARIAFAGPDADRIAGDLADRTTRLEALAVPDDISVREVFDLSYQALPPPTARLYRLLGLHPTGTFASAAAARLADEDAPAVVRSALHALLDASLLERRGPDRYDLHDLVHEHARDLAVRDEPSGSVRAATGRVVGHYLDLAVTADAAVSGRWRHGPRFAGPLPAVYDGPAAAVDALDAERENLLATVHLAARSGLDAEAWQLCEALWGLYFRRSYHTDWIDTHTVGLAAAVRCADRLAEARMHYQLGFAHHDRAATAEDDDVHARRHFEAALRLARELGHSRTESTALECLGLLDLRLGNPDAAATSFAAALTALRDIGHPRGRALLTMHRGRALSAAGRHDEAALALTDARDRFADLADDYNTARSLTCYAEDRRRAGLPANAREPLAEAAELMRREGAPHRLAEILLLDGDALIEAGDPDAARVSWRAALELYEALGGGAAAAEVRRRLAV
jgi:tetratricopeptide (TPR) repeat protein